MSAANSVTMIPCTRIIATTTDADSPLDVGSRFFHDDFFAGMITTKTTTDSRRVKRLEQIELKAEGDRKKWNPEHWNCGTIHIKKDAAKSHTTQA